MTPEPITPSLRRSGTARLLLLLVAIGIATAPVRAGDALRLPAPQCAPLIRGALWWIDPRRDGPRLNALLDAMQDVGMNVLWLFGTMPLADDPNDTLLERIFTQADRRRWRVIIETSWVNRWYVDWNIPALIETNRKHVEIVTRRYAQHPSFFGWYINYEIYMEWGEKSRKIRALYNAIGRMTRAATPKAKRTISPFYLADKDQVRAPFRYATPEASCRWWTETIRQAGIDIVMLQDSGAAHSECVSPRQRAAFFGAMQRACRANNAALWGNVETVEYRASNWPAYAARLKQYREAGTEYPWSFDMRRNAEKLDLASRFCSNLVTWGWEYWNPVVPQHKIGDRVTNYEAYKAYYHRITARTASPR